MGMLQQLATPIAADSIGNLEEGKQFVIVTFDDGFASTIERVIPVLTRGRIPATFFIPTAHLGQEASWISDTQRRELVGTIIKPEQLRLISKNIYVSIGSHGVHHHPITAVDDGTAFKELSESKKTLEKITGKQITMYCFPFGEYATHHISMARQAGYHRVFTVIPTMTYGNRENIVIGRIDVEPSDWPIEFKLKIWGAYRWRATLSHLKKCISEMISKT